MGNPLIRNTHDLSTVTRKIKSTISLDWTNKVRNISSIGIWRIDRMLPRLSIILELKQHYKPNRNLVFSSSNPVKIFVPSSLTWKSFETLSHQKVDWSVLVNNQLPISSQFISLLSIFQCCCCLSHYHPNMSLQLNSNWCWLRNHCFSGNITRRCCSNYQDNHNQMEESPALIRN